MAALVTGACAVVAQIIISNRTTHELYSKMDKQSEVADRELDKKIAVYAAATDTKIDELSREVRDHNGFARRIPVIEEQIKAANHRIDGLEKSR